MDDFPVAIDCSIEVKEDVEAERGVDKDAELGTDFHVKAYLKGDGENFVEDEEHAKEVPNKLAGTVWRDDEVLDGCFGVLFGNLFDDHGFHRLKGVVDDFCNLFGVILKFVRFVEGKLFGFLFHVEMVEVLDLNMANTIPCRSGLEAHFPRGSGILCDRPCTCAGNPTCVSPVRYSSCRELNSHWGSALKSTAPSRPKPAQNS